MYLMYFNKNRQDQIFTPTKESQMCCVDVSYYTTISADSMASSSWEMSRLLREYCWNASRNDDLFPLPYELEEGPVKNLMEQYSGPSSTKMACVNSHASQHASMSYAFRPKDDAHLKQPMTQDQRDLSGLQAPAPCGPMWPCDMRAQTSSRSTVTINKRWQDWKIIKTDIWLILVNIFSKLYKNLYISIRGL